MISIYAQYIKGKHGFKYYNSNYYKILIRKLNALKPVQALLPDKQEFTSAKYWVIEAGTHAYIGHNRKIPMLNVVT